MSFLPKIADLIKGKIMQVTLTPSYTKTREGFSNYSNLGNSSNWTYDVFTKKNAPSLSHPFLATLKIACVNSVGSFKVTFVQMIDQFTSQSITPRRIAKVLLHEEKLLEGDLELKFGDIELQPNISMGLSINSKTFIIGNVGAHTAAVKLELCANEVLSREDPLKGSSGCFPVWCMSPGRHYRLSNISDEKAPLQIVEFYTGMEIYHQ